MIATFRRLATVALACAALTTGTLASTPSATALGYPHFSHPGLHAQGQGHFAVAQPKTTVLVVGGSSPVQLSAGPCAPPPTGLVAWWPGDGNADDAGPSGIYDGSIYGGLGFMAGKVGLAFDFDGLDDSVLLPQHLAGYGLAPRGDWTISAWVRFSDAQPNGGIIYQNNGGPPIQMLLITDKRARLFYRGYYGDVNSVDITGGSDLNDGVWHHVAGVRSGAIGNLFVDGVLEATAAEPDVGVISHAFQWARIGAGRSDGGFDLPSNEQWFKGQIDEVQLYNRALSAADVADQAGCGSDVTPPDTAIVSAVNGYNVPVAYDGSTTSSSLTINFSGTDDVGVVDFQCSLDAESFETCLNPVVLPGLALGEHTFRVRAVDAANNVDLTPATWTWTVLTPADAVQQLIDTIKSYSLDPKGAEESLLSTLKNINLNNKPAACAKLKTFTDEHVPDNTPPLTVSQKAHLIGAANDIMGSLGGC